MAVQRYYLARVTVEDTGDGDGPQPRPKMFHRPFSEGTTATPLYDYPRLPWALVSMSNSSGVPDYDGDPDIDVLPEFPLDGEMGDMADSARAKLFAALDKWDLDLPEDRYSYRRVIRQLGQKFNPDFDEDDFGVPAA